MVGFDGRRWQRNVGLVEHLCDLSGSQRAIARLIVDAFLVRENGVYQTRHEVMVPDENEG